MIKEDHSPVGQEPLYKNVKEEIFTLPLRYDVKFQKDT